MTKNKRNNNTMIISRLGARKSHNDYSGKPNNTSILSKHRLIIEPIVTEERANILNHS